MKNLIRPLSEDEIQYLDDFLLDHVDEDAYTDGMDEGVLEMSGLDGFFTAIVSGPVSIPPSQWLPVVWGDFEPEWESEKEFETVFSLLIRYMNSIVSVLLDHPEDFEPLFLEREVKGKIYDIVDEWCEGYVQGIALTPTQWDSGGIEMKVLTAPILAFSSTTKWSAHDCSLDELVNIQKSIAPNEVEIHAYWLKLREEFIPVSKTVRHTEPHVGRNDPCPCGSGKKYKKCCLH